MRTKKCRRCGGQVPSELAESHATWHDGVDARAAEVTAREEEIAATAAPPPERPA